MQESLTPCYTISGSTNPSAWGTVPTSSDATWNAVTCDFTANGYRLPTEAEWEYAARGGNLANNGQTTYAGSDTIGDVARYKGNANTRTHEVKKKSPNDLGLYDMSGNVREWCWDRYAATIDTDTPATGPSSGSDRVIRGGGWGSTDEGCAVSYRNIGSPNNRHNDVGIRVVRTTTE